MKNILFLVVVYLAGCSSPNNSGEIENLKRQKDSIANAMDQLKTRYADTIKKEAINKLVNDYRLQQNRGVASPSKKENIVNGDQKNFRYDHENSNPLTNPPISYDTGKPLQQKRPKKVF